MGNFPGPITVNATSPQGATVTYTLPTATDEKGDNPGPVVSCTPAPGSLFPIGTTTITCTATDSDDINSPVSQKFPVTVNDTDLALTGVPANITTNATSSQGAVVTYIPPTVVDEDSPLPAVTCSPASGSTFPIGATTVTCTATDSSGNSVSASFQVTVTSVSDQITNLISLVKSFHLKPVIRDTLVTELQAAQYELSKNHTQTACSLFNGFVTEVRFLTGHGITAAQAKQLLAAAEAIETSLGCS